LAIPASSTIGQISGARDAEARARLPNPMTQPHITARYAQKREDIIVAATSILNAEGVKGMTLSDVGARVGLSTTSVTYYFKKKEELAATCLTRSIAAFRQLSLTAAEKPTVRERVAAFLDGYLDLDLSIRLGKRADVAYLGEIRALREPQLSVINAEFSDLVRSVRRLLDPVEGPRLASDDRRARGLILLEQLFWSSTWLHEYDPEDYSRVRDRILDILLNGLIADRPGWGSDHPPLPEHAPEEKDREVFLIVATRLINQRGYRGASVEDISAELNVTKGSFYHHNETKDELAERCFQRTFAVLEGRQRACLALNADFATRLTSVLSDLCRFQLSERGPLIRASALWPLPEPLRGLLIGRYQRITRRFTGMISDGIADGTLRAVDPVIASRMLTSAINGCAGLSTWLPDIKATEVHDRYVRPLMVGLLSDD
jgi:AcrR family transcriptional regulator